MKLGHRRWLLVTLLAVAVFPFAAWGAHDLGPPFFYDYQGNIWQSGKAILDGRNPYPAPPYRAPAAGIGPAYPPFVSEVFLPLSFLRKDTAGLIFGALMLACAAATLLVIHVRDPIWWIAAAGAPVVYCVGTANVTLLLCLLAACAWRWRDHAWRGGIAVACAVAVKLFVVPLIAWLAITRRFRAAIIATVGSIVLLVVPWAAIGFGGMRDFPALLKADAVAVGERGVFLQALLRQHGAGYTLALAIGILAGAAVIAWSTRLEDDRAFAAALLASLLVTPIAWVYYLWFGVIAVLVTTRSPRALTYMLLWLPVGTWATVTGNTIVALAGTLGLFAATILKPEEARTGDLVSSGTRV